MRIKNALAIATFAALGANANAQATISFTDPVQVYTGVAQTFTFGGSITNTTGSPITLDGDSAVADTITTLDVTGLPTSTSVTDAALPLTIAAGGSYTNADLFSVSMPAGFSYYAYPELSPEFTVTDDVDFANPVSFTGNTFIVNGVPEPGSVALLLGSGFGGSMLMLRRRRK